MLIFIYLHSAYFNHVLMYEKVWDEKRFHEYVEVYIDKSI